MRIVLLALAFAALAACTTASEGTSPFSGFQGGVSSGADTLGTSRRPDVYGGFTRPTTPSFGTR